ncbi:MAG: LysR family transcriptional regulator [Burkholderiaceae bacterium]
MAFSRVTIRQIEAFLAVAEQGSFVRAARRLGLSSSAVSQLVSELESVLGFRVFDRSTRRVELSGAGRTYRASAQAVLRQLQRAESVAADVRQRAAGVVRVAAPQVLASMFVPAAMRAYRDEMPRVVLRVIDTPVESLVEAVAQADVDIAIGPDCRHGEDVISLPVLDTPWVLWCSPEHPFARHRTVRWAQLKDIELVAAGRDHERSVEQMHAGLPDDQRITPIDIVDNLTTAFGIAAMNLSATLAPEYVGVLAERFGLMKRRVVDPEVIRRVCIFFSRDRAMTPAAEGFSEFLAKWLPSRVSQRKRKAVGRS